MSQQSPPSLAELAAEFDGLADSEALLAARIAALKGSGGLERHRLQEGLSRARAARRRFAVEFARRIASEAGGRTVVVGGYAYRPQFEGRRATGIDRTPAMIADVPAAGGDERP